MKIQLFSFIESKFQPAQLKKNASSQKMFLQALTQAFVSSNLLIHGVGVS